MASDSVFKTRKMEGTQQILFYKQFSIEVQVYVDSWTLSYSLSSVFLTPPPYTSILKE